MELAWLRDVAGRGGAAILELDPGGVTAAPVADAARGGTLGALGGAPIPLVSDGLSPLDCGRLPPVGGTEAGVVLRDGAFGGGGVARAEAVALLGSFLFTHFFSSGS